MSRLDSLAHRLPPAVIDRLRPAVGAARRALTTTPPQPGPSPYVQWHGPSVTDAIPAIACTPVADLLLVQGHAGEGVAVEVALANGDRIPITHRFPHPEAPTGPRTCFEITLAHHRLGSAESTATLVLDGVVQPTTVDLPAVPQPGAMVGVDTITSCPACGGEELHPTGRRQHLQMVTCANCHLVMTSPRPAEDHTLVRYNERYFEEEYLPSQTLSPSLRVHIDSILDHVEPAKIIAPSLFELGIGGGNLAARAAERGWDVRGTDVNPASVQHAANRGLDVWLENVDHADSLGGTYGAVVSEMSIEHVRRPDHFVALASKALAPGGRLVIYTVSAEGESFEHSGMASPLVGPAEHLFLFSAGSLVSLCEREGLRVELVWRNHTSDEIGVVASKRRDRSNPATS